jgi:hypothetical protein
MHCKLDREYRIAETYCKNLNLKSYLFLFLNKKVDIYKIIYGQLDREYRIAETYCKHLNLKSYLFLFLNKKIDIYKIIYGHIWNTILLNRISNIKFFFLFKIT